MIRAVLHFFLLGGLLYAAEQATDDWRALGFGTQTIEIGEADARSLREQWRRDLHREPAPAQLLAGLRRMADEEMLYREALRLGLDRSDPVVQGRLVQNMRFADGEAAGDAPVLLKSALALGMQHSDLVVRRRLVQRVEHQLEAGVRIADADIRAYIARHPERYQPPPRVRFTQVFLSADAHARDLDAAAVRLAARLQALPEQARVEGLGDPFLLGNEFPAAREREIAARFGNDFARVAMSAAAGEWRGPLRSSYGLHFLRVEARVPEAAPDAALLRRNAYYALLEERRQQQLQARIAQLRRHYRVQLDAALLGDAAAS